MKKVIGIGNALVDIMTSLENDDVIKSLGFPKGSMQLVDAEQSARIKSETGQFVKSYASGGSAANTMHGLAMLGVDAGFIGSIGRDDMGMVFENDMLKAGVKPFLIYRSSPTGTAVAMITPDSERTFGTHLGAAIELVNTDIDSAMFIGYDMLYLEGYLINNIELVRGVCNKARQAGLKIVIDLSSYNVVEAFRNEFREIVTEYVDIIFANEEEARAYTGKESEAALDELAEVCEIAVVKIGKEGSLIKRGDEKLKVGTLDVKSIDSTGAGDLYSAGFIYGIVNDEPLDQCGTYGTLLAGKVIEILGPKMTGDQWDFTLREIKRLKE
jgi:sugar/nucleoside kinase (ribokinase family)